MAHLTRRYRERLISMVPVIADACAAVSALDPRLLLVPRNYLRGGTGLRSSVPIFYAGLQTHLLENVFGAPPG